MTGILIGVINYVCLVFLDGKFGALMQVHIQNDGPVTIELISPSPTTDPKLVCLILLTHLVYMSWIKPLVSRNQADLIATNQVTIFCF